MIMPTTFYAYSFSHKVLGAMNSNANKKNGAPQRPVCYVLYIAVAAQVTGDRRTLGQKTVSTPAYPGQ